MIENGMRYLRGYVKIQIQGYSPERFLNLCSYHHILIWGLAYEDHCYEPVSYTHLTLPTKA